MSCWSESTTPERFLQVRHRSDGVVKLGGIAADIANLVGIACGDGLDADVVGEFEGQPLFVVFQVYAADFDGVDVQRQEALIEPHAHAGGVRGNTDSAHLSYYANGVGRRHTWLHFLGFLRRCAVDQQVTALSHIFEPGKQRKTQFSRAFNEGFEILLTPLMVVLGNNKGIQTGFHGLVNDGIRIDLAALRVALCVAMKVYKKSHCSFLWILRISSGRSEP